MKAILKNDFGTKLGIVSSWVESNTGTVTVIDYNKIQTKSHLISLQAFELKHKVLSNNTNIESSWIWRWYIDRIDNLPENLIIHCQLINPSAVTSFGIAGGQWLDAVEIEDNINILHIGTEDDEVMYNRAENSDLIPNRFKDYLSTSETFTKYIDYGLKIEIPNLLLGEKIYFHFIVATDLIKPSEYNSDEIDISTWLAVNQSKSFLDKIFTEKNI